MTEAEAPAKIRRTAKELRAIRAAREAVLDGLIALRRSGASFASIAKTYINPETGEPYYAGRGAAYNAWNRAIILLVQQPAESARIQELDRLDALQLAYWTKAIQGDVRAGDMVLKVMARRAKMEGLDQPERLDVLIRNGAERIAKELGADIEDVIADVERFLERSRS